MPNRCRRSRRQTVTGAMPHAVPREHITKHWGPQVGHANANAITRRRSAPRTPGAVRRDLAAFRINPSGQYDRTAGATDKTPCATARSADTSHSHCPFAGIPQHTEPRSLYALLEGHWFSFLFPRQEKLGKDRPGGPLRVSVV